ncbi:MAG: BolA family transcriptional regulator [Alphaproteobacteria bacterium]
MAVSATTIERQLKKAFPDAKIAVNDLVGDGDHYAVKVVSSAFRGKTRVEQHRLVNEALKEELGEKLHALAIQTNPDQE